MPSPREVRILPAEGMPYEESALPKVPEEPQSKLPNARQTFTYLRGLMESHGLHPKAKLGQNFLVDLNLLELVCKTAELGPQDSVLEVGTGTGSLTALMAEHAGCVYTAEIDTDFHRLAKQIVGPRSNVEFFLGDALARKNELSPEMLKGWAELSQRFGTTRRKLVANLPYVIATPVISNLLISDIPIERMVVMVQWEIGERLQARASTKDYNALSVLVQSLAEVEIVRKVLPTNFYPKPKVDSAIVLIRPDPEKRAKVGDVLKFRHFLRDLYIHRRKNLRQALMSWPTGRRDKNEVDTKLQEIGIDGGLRAESLDLEQHLVLSRAFT